MSGYEERKVLDGTGGVLDVGWELWRDTGVPAEKSWSFTALLCLVTFRRL